MLCVGCNKKDVMINKDESDYCKRCESIIEIERVPKSISEWKNQQTSKPPRLIYCVKSESTSGIVYEIEYFVENNCY